MDMDIPLDAPQKLQEPSGQQSGTLLPPVKIRRLMRLWCDLTGQREAQVRVRAHWKNIGRMTMPHDEWEEALLREEIRQLEKQLAGILAARAQARTEHGTDAPGF